MRGKGVCVCVDREGGKGVPDRQTCSGGELWYQHAASDMGSRPQGRKACREMGREGTLEERQPAVRRGKRNKK
ncbi:hypothetical protein FQA47_023980 [Oryzias melastigma]|uniref:Uncharacterized protein n=1 Tax=Oryzias melastigma TaxID=30732 RepID=A0A834L1T1_ORYME|nr:hypothetical protein FQA47_023980 [Oryzias melastigma]